MPRKRPTSTRQKKADTQLKRAIKRGDVPAPDPSGKPAQSKPKPPRVGPTGAIIGASSSHQTAESSGKLQSHFLVLPPHYLEETKDLAASLPLTRPISPSVSTLQSVPVEPNPLTCPKRPKWRYEMTKKEVERNEEGFFKKWINEVDDWVERWCRGEPIPGTGARPNALDLMPHSPTYFERNLEVWRQLWRVVEISQIILVLLDSRCPLVHYPPSLRAYLESRKVILVLTKVDISGEARADAWTRYLQTISPGVRVVQVESYSFKATTSGGKGHYEPKLPHTTRERLIKAIKELHAELLEPPEKVKNPAWLEKWIPPVKREIDWNPLSEKAAVRVEGLSETNGEPPSLTIGLIGQPNVGKSSLLNAIFGTQRVRASKTPGKTKHFQTLFWTPDVRLVDCPGLVVPNFLPLETQVLSGILPISNVSAVPACVYYAAQLLPLETILHLSHPKTTSPQPEDKRTWRDGMKSSSVLENREQIHWTAMDILVAYANRKGWVTAKAGRPDIHRAGNAVLRALAEGKIAWAFSPPDADAKGCDLHHPEDGIWLSSRQVSEELGDEGNISDSETLYYAPSESDSDASDDEMTTFGVVEESLVKAGLGRFAALSLDDGEDDDELEETDIDVDA